MNTQTTTTTTDITPISQTRLIDVITTLTNYCEVLPSLYSSDDQSELYSALFVHQRDEEGHAQLSVLLDVTNQSITMIENEATFSLISKYTICGIAVSNHLKFDHIVSDGCVECANSQEIDSDVNSKSDSSDTTDSTSNTITTGKRQRTILH